jgi:hypothetical protein
MAKMLATAETIQGEILRRFADCAGDLPCGSTVPPLRACDGNSAGANWTIDTLEGVSPNCVPCFTTAMLSVMRDFDLE